MFPLIATEMAAAIGTGACVRALHSGSCVRCVLYVRFVVEKEADSVLLRVRTSNTQLLQVARRDPDIKYLNVFSWNTELVSFSVSAECTSRRPPVPLQELFTRETHDMSPPRMSGDRYRTLPRTLPENVAYRSESLCCSPA